jgi:PhzF family phenazine biosynthesis protein
MASSEIHVVDAFARRPFEGNPAAVCFPDGPRDEAWMQRVAAEMRHSETAFLSPLAEGFALRWFTPEAEVDLCGHATLAAAHVVWETKRAPFDAALSFATRSGTLVARRRDDLVEIDLPARPADPAPVPREVLAATGVAAAVRTARDHQTYVVELESEAAVRGLAPDFAAMRALTQRGALDEDIDRRVLVTAPASTPGFDVVSRYFAPALGVPEDPVTGAGHCVLGPYWAPRLGRTRFVAWQASARGGGVHVEVRGDRVALAGSAVTVLRGWLSA